MMGQKDDLHSQEQNKTLWTVRGTVILFNAWQTLRFDTPIIPFSLVATFTHDSSSNPNSGKVDHSLTKQHFASCTDSPFKAECWAHSCLYTFYSKRKKWDLYISKSEGNTTVVIRMEDYSTKRKGIFETPTNWQLGKDPPATQENRLSRKLKQLEKRHHGQFVQSTRLSGKQPPSIYGLYKIHKTEVALRLIVSCIRSPSY